MDSGGLFSDCLRRRVAARVRRDAAFRGSTALATVLLAALVAGEAAGQPAGLFREVTSPAAAIAPGLPTAPDAITLRRRLVVIDFGQLTPSADTAAAVPAGTAAAPSGVLTLNLFDDASFAGLVQSVAPTFSGGYSLSGPLAGVEMGTMTLVVNGEVVAGTVRTPEATYRIRPARGGLHVVSEVDLSRLPPLGEPIPGRGWEEEERPPLPAALRATGDAPRADAQGSIATDRAALEALYDATDGPNWTDNTNWKTDAPLGEWFGVTMHQGRVWGVDLPYNGLAGSIPSDLGSLTNVRWLFLYLNALTGTIPGELGNLTNLQSLALGFNDLSGPIPNELGRLVNLRYLDLIYNNLSGSIPSTLGRLGSLETLYLSDNELTGQVPAWLGNLDQLRRLSLMRNPLTGGPIPGELGTLVNLEVLLLEGLDLSGPIPSELGNLINLQWLDLDENWGLSGPLPAGLRQAPLEDLYIFSTQTCAPNAWRDWLETIDFNGRLCGSGTVVTIDVAAIYTLSAREAAGGVGAIEAEIDLMVAATNQAYEVSGVHHRVALAERSEVSYTESGDSLVDLRRLGDPSDGHMDRVHEMRDLVGADLVHLVVGESDVGGRAYRPGVFSVGKRCCLAHELGHNMGLRHERYEQSFERDWGGGVLTSDPAYGYVNQRAFEPGAAPSSCWGTIMAYGTQCTDEGLRVSGVARFSNPRQQYEGDPLGVLWATNASAGVDGPADAVSVLNATGPAVALWRDRPAGPNRPPTAVGGLPNRRLPDVGGTLRVDVSSAFADPDGDTLTYAVSSSAPRVVSVLTAGARVTLTALAEGTAMIRVTASDPGGLTVTQTCSVTVGRSSAPFTDPEIVPGVTPVRAVHFTELRTRIDGLRTAAGLSGFAWTDPALTAGVTPVRLVHLLDLRSALAAAYTAAGRAAPPWTDQAPVGGTTPIRAAHLMELRAAVRALE